jgi:hypothetical protein
VPVDEFPLIRGEPAQGFGAMALDLGGVTELALDGLFEPGELLRRPEQE